MIEWLRRMIGPPRQVADELTRMRTRADRANASVLRMRQERDEERRETAAELSAVREALAVARAHERGAQRALNRALEPAQGDDCRKVRLRDREEAERYARHVENATGRDVGSLGGYKCTTCPRQPVTMSRFWHVANRDPAMRSGRPEATAARRRRYADADRDGRTIGQRVGWLQRPGDPQRDERDDQHDEDGHEPADQPVGVH